MTALTNPRVPQRIVEVFGIAEDIVALPDFGNTKATRKWLGSIIEIAESIPDQWVVWLDLCEKEDDDDIIAFLRQAVRDDNLYDSLYRMLIVCLSTGRPLTPEESALAVQLLAEAAEKAGVDPQNVLAAVQDIASLVRFIRDSVSRSSTY